MKNIKDLRDGQKKMAKNLSDLVNPETFVGWVYSIDYERALILTNDLWKYQANGIPHNCFLLAASFDPNKFDSANDIDKEVILLRVTGSSKLPQDDDLVRSRIDYYQQQKEIYKERGFDPITLNQMQFGALECRVLGTFYIGDNELWLGSDIESFPSASRLKTYRPKGEALETIVNYVDPIRKGKGIEEAKDLGLAKPPEPFQIGTIRYTSTARLQRSESEDKVPVRIQPSDFLARRTAVLGMTRTGKSNMIKQLVSVVRKTSNDGGLPIGQIVFDMNGEYANANKQDKGAIADVFPDSTVRYRLLPAEGFQPLQNNFYEQLQDGYALMIEILSEKKSSSGDLQFFLNLSFEKPEEGDFAELRKYNIRKAAYWGLLYKAGFKPRNGLRTFFEANVSVVTAVNEQLEDGAIDIKKGLTPAECSRWFAGLRKAYKSELAALKESKKPKRSSKDEEIDEPSKKVSDVEKWMDSKDDVKAMVNLLESKNERDTYILGYKLLAEVAKFHTPERTKEVGEEIYRHLVEGKIVILDLSVGRPSLRQRLTDKIAEKIFSTSMDIFVNGKNPPNIVMYIEEAHNLIGKTAELDDTWPRIAKEGAKYRVALVYATQEVSAMHANILANTENWFITHLNNSKEIGELARFYDFGDFSQSLIRAQDVGFARIKTLSSSYVIPAQIDKFDPSKLK
ncbi:helicase HerA domain-containing protein [Bdellovibrio sp. HCB185ZH]|uniref:helicase HerA domain-containing protein n=1 Tax=Bdellovibrio sp. HCB185ZH TaxID=3394235 RepID=UPI0039A63E11